ncbi:MULTISPECIES: glycerol-3-phosphate responsive antiterminator [Clostridium]|jgi:Glycerol-3-phosphate responsive antiterminator (mRNA-binding)|uniref:Antiterminator n=5 Tax=Clostridium TaxID=1485 RepID=A0A1S8RUC8_CLOBE|nr:MULTISPECIES: glycerol-3-phosphate responsive antiterminator [Clostridium]ABR36619.1 glycerol-3-phosphate responsive antiterminator [Clostridium beijerinckii NCIMB 8052]AIU02358.1 glycerol-3-phosphate responsive antiterminator [Clostridium beijerinckii ATCC 35702]ALB44346.1 glycerol-3-phosphate responsive antiterminator [Clostridium beijerinckii NRRL B-598]MBC2456985.1 glycerol-3-phosphate responsive antiterminator [Clostridium beijerinckii]MBC2473451.1 glycerol-3-phosphate responsive antit
MNIKELLEENPIIAAVKNEEQLNQALDSEAQVIFVLFGDVMNIKEISEIITSRNKIGIIHIDLVEGFTNKEIVVKYIKEETKFSGIISTKPQVVKLAKKYNLLGVQRVFIFDTLSLNNVKNHMISECDAIEVLPGIIPKVIEIISKYSSKPVVAGGLIETKEEVMQALNSGATCVSTTKKEIWNM